MPLEKDSDAGKIESRERTERMKMAMAITSSMDVAELGEVWWTEENWACCNSWGKKQEMRTFEGANKSFN